MEISYILLIITCFLYGATTFIAHWEDFGSKLLNILVLIAILVLTILTGEDGFIYYSDDMYWLNYLFPVGAIIFGYWIGHAIVEPNDDWGDVIAVLAGLGMIATIITTCCGI